MEASAGRWPLLLGALNGAVAVMLGAYGAHALAGPERIDLFHTALQYHVFHALGLLIAGLSTTPRARRWFAASAALMCGGILLFCGNLYLIAIAGYRGLSMLTPIGGTAFILAWIVFAVAAWRR